MKALFSILAAGLLLCGCAGTRFNFDDARTVRVGMSEAEVRQIMGKPYMVVARPNDCVWVYSYANGLGAARSVSFVLADGKVIEVPKIPESFGGGKTE